MIILGGQITTKSRKIDPETQAELQRKFEEEIAKRQNGKKYL